MNMNESRRRIVLGACAALAFGASLIAAGPATAQQKMKVAAIYTVPVEYYFKVPDDIAERLVIVVDPMLATGNSAVAALSRLKEAGAVTIKYVCLLAAPEGIAVLKAGHPEVPIYTAAVDDHLNDHGYIIPGLGDAGDRLFGTK